MRIDLTTLPARIQAKVTVDPISGCWFWTGYVMANGYGQCWYAGKVTSAHRAVYQIAHGPIDDALKVDHLCRRPRCVNPNSEHTEPVTNRENLARGALGPLWERTHCSNGHELTAINVFSNRSNGMKRGCRTCRDDYMRGYNRRYHAARKGA